jgi:hypothetical protein
MFFINHAQKFNYQPGYLKVKNKQEIDLLQHGVRVAN